MRYTIKEIFNKINLDLCEYDYIIRNLDFKSYRFDMVFNVSIAYNKRFSENINFIVKNVMNNNIIENWTVNIKDLDHIKNKLEVF